MAPAIQEIVKRGEYSFLTCSILAIRNSSFSIFLAHELQDDLADLAYSALKLKLGVAISESRGGNQFLEYFESHVRDVNEILTLPSTSFTLAVRESVKSCSLGCSEMFFDYAASFRQFYLLFWKNWVLQVGWVSKLCE